MQIRSFRLRAATFVFTTAAVGLLIPANAANGGAKPVPPNSQSHGNSYAEWSVKWWLWDFSLPIPLNPTVTPGADCTNGQSGQVWFLYGGPATVNCTIRPGTALFLPVVNTECSSLEAPPFFGATAADRAACAKAWIDFVTQLSATIDGVPVTNLSLFRVQTGDFPFSVPANNFLGVAGPASGFSSGDGYYLLLNPLPPGTHTIHIAGTFHDPFDPAHPVIFPLDTTITVTVSPH
jgi:hypothetical protein